MGLTYWKMVLGFSFPQTTCYVQETREENSTSTANAKMPTFTYKQRAATGKPEKWRENHDHMVTFAVRVSRTRVAKSL